MRANRWEKIIGKVHIPIRVEQVNLKGLRGAELENPFPWGRGIHPFWK
jgi:hypothetical protein